MVKCEPCNEGKCENKYENRHMCKDPKNCTCSCQETATEGFLWGFGSVALGAAAFAGGVVLTVSTVGLGAVGIAAAVVGGGALTGAGATAAIHPIAKQLNGERMTIREYGIDVAIGGAIGAITGPIGAGGASATSSIASKVGTEGVKQGAVKLAGRTAVGAVSGATASVVQELTNPGEFSGMNVLKGAALGAATGGVGHVSGNISSKLSSGVAQSVTKVVADTAGAAVIDVTSQLIENREVDGKRLAMNVGARAATSAGYEAVAGATYKALGGKEALQDKLGDKQMLDEMDSTDKEKVLQAKEFLEKTDQTVVEREIRLADGQELEAAKADHNNLKKEWNRLNHQTKDEIGKINKEIQLTKTDTSLTSDQQQSRMDQLQTQKAQLAKDLKTMQQKATIDLNVHKDNVIEPAKTQMMGEQNVHALGKIDNNKVGQFAADLPNPNDNNNGERGLRRVIYDVKPNEDGTLRTKIVTVVEGHKYAEAPGYGQVKGPELIESKPFIPLKDDDEDDKKKKKKKKQ